LVVEVVVEVEWAENVDVGVESMKNIDLEY
jgi:hypothetical protein